MKPRIIPKLLPIALVVLVGGLLVMTEATKAQDPDPAPTQPTDPVIEALEREKKIAELKKGIAEAERDAFLAGLPSSDTTGSPGSVTVDDKAGYYAELTAYGTLATAAGKIATKLGDGSKAKIILTDEMELAQKMQLWHLIEGRLDRFDTEFAEQLNRTKDVADVDPSLELDPLMESLGEVLGKLEGVGALVAGIPALLGGIADIAAFFKVDVELKGRDVTLAKRALIAEVASALSKKWTVILPDLNRAGTGALLTKLDGLATKRRQLVERRLKIERIVKKPLAELAKLRKKLAAKKAELAQLRKAEHPDKPKIDAVNREIDDLEDQIVPFANIETAWNRLKRDFDTLLTGYDQYRKAVTESTGDKPAPIESLAIVDVIKGESLANRLHLDIASQGGEIHITKSVWSSGRISYLGGSVCVYFWIDEAGTLKGAQSIPLWEGKSFKASKGSEQLNVEASP